MLKKGLAVAVILLFIGMCVVPSTAVQELREKTSLINFDGNTLYVGGSGPNNYTKIQDAINDAVDGDTVFVYDGTYFENIVVNKSINLIGEDKHKTIIDSEKIGNVVTIVSDEVSIRGFLIKNSSYDYYPKYYAGILIHSNNNIISSNIISNNQHGIYCYKGSSNSLISKNIIIYNKGEGIYLKDDNNHLSITNNTIMRNIIGVCFWEDACYNKISFNNISNNSAMGIIIHGSNFNVISSNIIAKNGKYNPGNPLGSIIIERTHNTDVYRNHILDNSYGIVLNDANHNNVYLNNFKNCTYAIYHIWTPKNNFYYRNNFINNTHTVETDTWYDKWDKNYWNEPRIFPKVIWGRRMFWIIKPNPYYPGLGFGFKLPWPMFDWHPAQEPYDIGV